MNQHRSLLVSLFALVFGFALWGNGCASGGQTSAASDGGESDVTTPGDATSDANSCTGGKTMCSGACTSTTTDPKNCGACGHVCMSGQVCSQGACATGCSGGETLCGGPPEAGAPEAGPVVDSGTASGEAGEPEDGGEVESGTPVVDSGSPVTGDAGAPYCASLNNDPANCGACGVSCGSGTCTNGTCTAGTCPAGQVACAASGTCIPTGTCCNTGECTITNEICPMPGGVCQCPSGEKPCMGTLMACVSNAACCDNADCANMNGETCGTPGMACTCPIAGAVQCCVGTDCPMEPNVATAVCSTSATPPPNVCSVGTCTAGCYDLDSKFSDGCECCNTTTAGQSCATAMSGGTMVTPGATLNVSGQIPEPTGGDWYTFAFAAPPTNSETYHPKITLTANPSTEFVFDVLSGACPGTPMTCGDETPATSTGDTTWEQAYQTAAPPTGPDLTSKSPSGVSNFQPIPALGTLLVHVYRASTTAPATCDQYTLTVSE
jgi:hypothetical protein